MNTKKPKKSPARVNIRVSKRAYRELVAIKKREERSIVEVVDRLLGV